MNIFVNGYIYENTRNEYIMNAEHEKYVGNMLELDSDMLYSYFKSNTVIPVFRVFQLNQDETIKCEISRDVISASLSLSYQNGQRASLRLDLANIENQWNYGAKNTFIEGIKFRLDCGALIKDTVYWQTQGVFILQDVNYTILPSDKKVSLTLCDKWGLWDGSVYGTNEFNQIIPAQTPIRQVIDRIIHEENNLGEMWDIKECYFNSEHSDDLNYYTIRQDAGQKRGDILLSIAKTISADMFYDTRGHLNIESNILEFINANFPLVWRFSDGDLDCGNPSIKYNKSKYYNRIVTKGAIVNGYQFKGTVENNNPLSMYNTIDYPYTTKLNKNSKLFSDNLCREQSMYEMVNQSRGRTSFSITSGYLPFLSVNDAVSLNFKDYELNGDLYIIDSISYNIGSACTMSISMTSMYEVTF